jgi:hypothetical protein
MRGLSVGNPGMDQATDLSEADGNIAFGREKTLSSQHDKPLIYCENCTKTPEEIGGNSKFMACGSCKSKLDFTVYYCSR